MALLSLYDDNIWWCWNGGGYCTLRSDAVIIPPSSTTTFYVRLIINDVSKLFDICMYHCVWEASRKLHSGLQGTVYIQIFEGCNFQDFRDQLTICKIFHPQNFIGKTVACISWRAWYIWTATSDTCKQWWQVSTLSATATENKSRKWLRLTTSLTFSLHSVWLH